MDKTNRKLIDHFIGQLSEIQNGRPWMGESFEKKLDSITNEEAFQKPGPAMHSVAEILAHLTAWNDDLILKITYGKGKLLDSDPQNWPDNETLWLSGWDQVREKYTESVRTVISLLSEKEDSFFGEKYSDQDFNGEYLYAFAMNGMLQHQVYHLGQLGIIIKMIKKK